MLDNEALEQHALFSYGIRTVFEMTPMNQEYITECSRKNIPAPCSWETFGFAKKATARVSYHLIIRMLMKCSKFMQSRVSTEAVPVVLPGVLKFIRISAKLVMQFQQQSS